MQSVMKVIKAVAGAGAAFLLEVGFVLQDDSVSLDEINKLWLALIPLGVALGVYVSPKNQP